MFDQDDLENMQWQESELRRRKEHAEKQDELKRSRQELAAIRAQQAKESSLPQCPVCGGRIEPNFRKCKHCATELAWVENVPCEPNQIDKVRTEIERKKHEKAEKHQRALAAREASRLPCKNCGQLYYPGGGAFKRCPECNDKFTNNWIVPLAICAVGAVLSFYLGEQIMYNVELQGSTEPGYSVPEPHSVVQIVVGGMCGLLGFLLSLFVATPIWEVLFDLVHTRR